MDIDCGYKVEVGAGVFEAVDDDAVEFFEMLFGKYVCRVSRCRFEDLGYVPSVIPGHFFRVLHAVRAPWWEQIQRDIVMEITN